MKNNIAEDEVMSYKTLYRMIGFLGMILPILDVWKCNGVVPLSISDSYYLGAIVPFVLILGSLGLIFFCNSGFNSADKWCNRISGIAALMVISFPCRSENKIAGILFKHIHYASAIVLFVTFAFMCLFVFTKVRSSRSVIDGKMKQNKVYRNIIYIICGIFILIGMPFAIKYTFWSEVWMLESFGFAYLIQGKTFFKD